MDATLIILIIFVVVALAIGFAAYRRIAGLKAENNSSHEHCDTLQRQITDLTVENARLTERTASLEADNRRLTDSIAEQAKQQQEQRQEQRQEQQQQFELLARRIVEQESRMLRENHNREITHLLAPLKEDINKFKTRVEECYANESRERFSLSEKIRDLIEANHTIGKQAQELSMALRGDTKKQGDWGELVLERLLEKSGLRRGEEFDVQVTTDENGNVIRDENGRGLRPDVVVRYPDRGCMVIDSKVSLTAFTQLVNATDDAEREEFVRRHVMSVMRHVTELSGKRYEEYVGPKDHLDFVMMFIPNEGAFAAAMQADPMLWEKAYEQRVLITSPTQLMGALRIVSQMWRHDRQAKNAAEIALKSGQMYNKFASFVDDLLKVEQQLKATSNTLTEAKKKLSEGRGNLVSRAKALRALGVKASKQVALEAAQEDDDNDATDESDE